MSHEPKISVTGRHLSFSAAVRRRNPDLFNPGAVVTPEPQQKAQRSLERQPQGRQQCQDGAGQRAPRFRVTLVSLRRRRLDRDNLIGGFKPMRDALAQFIGLDDAERFIEWEYDQCETRGREETLVRIEIL